MEWRRYYLDVILVPLGLLINIAYHVWLWHKVQTQPLKTTIGTYSKAQRLWIPVIMKDIDKKNILAIQTVRNLIMGSTLMATTTVLLSGGLAAVISSTYSVKKPLNDNVYGAQGEFMVALKYVTLLATFLLSFFCHSMSISFLNQVNILVSTLGDPRSILTPEYVSDLLEKASLLNAVGNRIFYAAFPLLLWIFGPVLVFLCFLTMVPVLYNHDILDEPGKRRVNSCGETESA